MNLHRLRSKKIKTGKSRTTTFSSWDSMIQRCYNGNNGEFKNYGGRGISVCERWHTFANFLYDMGEKTITNYTIERINNDGNYEPQNCKWATLKENCRNRRTNRLITYDGTTKCLIEWAEILNMKFSTLSKRIKRWDDIERAFTQPVEYRS